MLEAEIQKLTAAISANGERVEGELRQIFRAIVVLNDNIQSLTKFGVAAANLYQQDAAAREAVRAQKSYQEDDAYRAGLQAARDASAQRADQQIAQDAAATKPAKAAKAKAAPAPEPAPEPVSEPEPASEPAPSISKENLKSMALSMSRADHYAKSQIYEVLGKYGVKTITALPDDPDALHDVFTGFTKIADRIAKSAE
jgi:hypothetical protein